jgi:hypothetical protein
MTGKGMVLIHLSIPIKIERKRRNGKPSKKTPVETLSESG